MLELPEILNVPLKLIPFVTNLGKYRYYLAEGGRGSGKSQVFGRLVLYLCEKRKVSVCCGQRNTDLYRRSVYKLLVKLIKKYELNFEITSAKIRHRVTGSEIISGVFANRALKTPKVWKDLTLFGLMKPKCCPSGRLMLLSRQSERKIRRYGFR